MPIDLLAQLDDPKTEREFEKFAKRNERLMMSVAISVLERYHDAEEAVIQALTGIARNFSRVSKMEESIQKAYVCRATRNEAIKILNERNRRDKREIPLEQVSEIGVSDGEILRICEGVELEKLRDCLLKLPERIRDVFQLYYGEGYSTRKIAEALSMKRETVKTLLKRGKSLLKAELEKEGESK